MKTLVSKLANSAPNLAKGLATTLFSLFLAFTPLKKARAIEYNSAPQNQSSSIEVNDVHYGGQLPDTNEKTLSKSTGFDVVVINPYVQPNDSTKAFYGSGDLNDDTKVDSLDEEILKSNLRYFPERADMDGNGTPFEEEDLEKMQAYTAGSSLPQLHWQSSKILRNQRKDWMKKMLSIDKIDELPYVSGEWECGQFATQTAINMSGLENPKDSSAVYFEKFDFSNYNRFNLGGFYYVSLSSDNLPGGANAHAINACLVGENPLDFNDWVFIEPQTDAEITIGSQSMPTDSRDISIKRIGVDNQGNVSYSTFVKWDLVEGEPKLTYYYSKGLVTQRPKDPDTKAPEIYVYSPKTNETHGKSVLETKLGIDYFVSDPALDTNYASSGVRGVCFSPDSGKTNICLPDSSGTFLYTPVPGENVWRISAEDNAGNYSEKYVKFFVDTTNVAIDDPLGNKYKFELSQNYPNPFNNGTKIKYSIPLDDKVKLQVYDLQGKLVKTLVNKRQEAGEYEVPFEGSKYSSGVYFYKLQTTAGTKTKRFTLTK